MISFIKTAIQEIEHVVWPTVAETRKYFTIVTIMIAISATVLLAFGTMVSKGMFAIRSVTPHDVKTISSENIPSEDILNQLKIPASTTSTGTAVSAPATPKN
ncbi:MAG: preprotein translocase subunit SecE [Candidatus Gracilibacteria bacterium]|nr:preprotein translocase subunit SecE [Candidatus Gracilibacteria bacterium]